MLMIGLAGASDLTLPQLLNAEEEEEKQHSCPAILH